MFRLRAKGLPADPVFPADLDKLGYYINHDDQIRNKQYPSDPYRYRVNKNTRYNDVYREAFNQTVREEVISRLGSLDLKPFYLPQCTEEKPTQTANVPIIMTPPEQLSNARQVILINNACTDDLGIWSYRVTSNIGTIDSGSVVSIVKDIRSRSPSAEAIPGFIILNPGQLMYSYGVDRAMTPSSWDAQPRRSGVHGPPTCHPLNQIPSNNSAAEHVSYVFKNIVQNEKFVSRNADIYCIARSDGAGTIADYLDKNWSELSTRVSGLALAAPGLIEAKNIDFGNFLRDQTMAWILSHHDLNTPLSNVDEAAGGLPFPTRSGGDDKWAEAIIPTSYPKILDWFEEIGRSSWRYKNPKMEIPEAVKKELEEARLQQIAPTWGQDDDGVAIEAAIQGMNEDLETAKKSYVEAS